MLVSQKFYEKDFIDETSSKEAYLKACTWVAKNILAKTSKVEASKVTWKIYNVTKDLPTFRLELFVSYEEEEVSTQMCSVCKELHSSFFINENFNCDRCNKEAYRKKINTKLTTGCTWFKEQLSKMLESYN
jgi:uncharacterized paraquat-inducible protein A